MAALCIPIVLAVANDRVGGGLVASLSRPGGNVTGLSLQARDIVGKRFLRKIVPDLQGGAYQRLHFGKWSRARSVVVAEIDLASIRPLNEIEENARAPVRDLGR